MSLLTYFMWQVSCRPLRSPQLRWLPCRCFVHRWSELLFPGEVCQHYINSWSHLAHCELNAVIVLFLMCLSKINWNKNEQVGWRKRRLSVQQLECIIIVNFIGSFGINTKESMLSWIVGRVLLLLASLSSSLLLILYLDSSSGHTSDHRFLISCSYLQVCSYGSHGKCKSLWPIFLKWQPFSVLF